METLRPVLLAGLGGFIGSAARYLVGGWVHGWFSMTTFPLGTLVVNASGCLLIGLLSGLAESRQLLGPDLRLFLMIGVLGGFTTFSSFAYETLALARDGEFSRAVLNVGAQLVLGLGFAWLGYAVVRS